MGRGANCLMLGGVGYLRLGGPIYFFFIGYWENFFFCRGHGPPKPLCGSAPEGENIILRTPKIPKNYSLDGTNDLRKKRTLDKDNSFIAHPSITSLKSTN